MTRRLGVIVLVAMLGYLQYRLWVGDGSFVEVWQLTQDIAQQRSENDQLKERNAALDAEVQDLKHGMAAIEERARNELGMIKKDETFYRVVEQR